MIASDISPVAQGGAHGLVALGRRADQLEHRLWFVALLDARLVSEEIVGRTGRTIIRVYGRGRSGEAERPERFGEEPAP